ncbi:hypothetical protein EFN92_12270 [Lactococcus lactis]|uniref:hypothetical protein n=1 Tax=Lactococcus lactis TaxID=1358 RepID=UPI0021A7D963|nr:hypothetical protein [Lactococcus lactis]MCT3093387.1 hypothetical protein [Lactococcus lactis]
MNETAINYFLVELDRKLKDLEFFSKQQGISLGAAKRANEIHKEIIELIRPFSTGELLVEKLQEQLNTAKKALTEISVIPTKFDDGGAGEIAVEIARDALAAIGNEGSGDE